MNPGGFCSVQRRYTLVEREEVHSIYPHQNEETDTPKMGPCTLDGSRNGFAFLRRNLARTDKSLSLYSLQPASLWPEIYLLHLFVVAVVVRSLRCPSLCDPMDCTRQAPLSFTVPWSLRKFRSIASVMSSNHLILWPPLLLPPSIFPSIRVFSNESALRIGWPKYWSFSFSISPSNEYSELIFFRVDRFGLLAIQETLRVFSSTTVQKHQCFSAQPSFWSNSHICT